jgi:hypothetical protein
VKISSILKFFLFAFGFITFSITAFFSTAIYGQSSYELPSKIDKSAKYFLFLHNYYVEKNGPDGECKYYSILEAFAEKGFIVVSEIRTGKIVPCTYANKVVKQVNTLLKAGVPPQNITIAGHSKGAVISLCVASELENPNINFVVMAGCEIVPIKKFKMYPDFNSLQGRILSIFATSDTIANSCKEAFSMASNGFSGTEIKLESQEGHKLFFAPAAIWISPTVDWINNSLK